MYNTARIAHGKAILIKRKYLLHISQTFPRYTASRKREIAQIKGGTHYEKEELCNCQADKIKELESALLRKDADLINYRKRKDEEVAKMLKYSNEEIAKELLPIVDNFERAISLDDDNLEDELSKFLEGFKMIYCHLNDVLNKFEVKAIDGNKKPFDPNYHQAVLTEKVEGMEPGLVIEVMQKGYLLKDKVIRAAMVKVSE